LMAHMRRAQSARERQCVLPLRRTPLSSFRQLLLSGVVLLRCFGGAFVAVAAAMMHGGVVAPLQSSVDAGLDHVFMRRRSCNSQGICARDMRTSPMKSSLQQHLAVMH
jgi:hypothetical protein